MQTLQATRVITTSGVKLGSSCEDPQCPLRSRSALFEEQRPDSENDYGEKSLSSVESSGPKYTGRTAVVIGAGPSGSIAAACLAKHGFRVKVFERRGDPDTVEANTHRSIYIVLRPSTLQTMSDAGVMIPPEEGGYVNGLHAFKGQFRIKRTGELVENDPDTSSSVFGERHNIARCIVAGVREAHKDQLDFFFNHECTGVSFEDQIVTLVDKNGEELQEEYDLLVAADGLHSIVRSQMETTDPDFQVRFQPTNRAYVSVRSMELPPADSDVSVTLRSGHFTVMALKKKKFNGKPCPSRLTYYVTEERNVNAILSAPQSHFDNIHGKEEEWAKAVLPKYLPEEWKTEIVSQLKARDLSMMSPMARLSKLVGPKLIIIGDAGHCVTPALGFGCNQAITDSKLLTAALEEGRGDITEAVQSFNNIAYRELQSLQELQESVPGQGLTNLTISQRCWALVGSIHLVLYTVGNQLFPQRLPPAVYFAYLRDRISATTAVQRLRRDGWIFLGCFVAMLCVFGRKLLTRLIQLLASKCIVM